MTTDSSNTTTVGSILKRVLAYVIVIAVFLLTLKLLGAIVLGFLKILLTIVVAGGAIAAIVWALRRL